MPAPSCGNHTPVAGRQYGFLYLRGKLASKELGPGPGSVPDCPMSNELAHGQVAGDFATKLSEAWNGHDMQAFADLFHDDAAFVNVNGTYAHARH